MDVPPVWIHTVQHTSHCRIFGDCATIAGPVARKSPPSEAPSRPAAPVSNRQQVPGNWRTTPHTTCSQATWSTSTTATTAQVLLPAVETPSHLLQHTRARSRHRMRRSLVRSINCSCCNTSYTEQALGHIGIHWRTAHKTPPPSKLPASKRAMRPDTPPAHEQ
jgi:hypothetical protein